MMERPITANLDQTLMALADPTRRAILRRLLQGEARVTELAEPFPISLNAVSKHIRVLERAGLVRRRVVGREHLLAYNPAPLSEAATWIAEQQAAWRLRLDALERELSAISHQPSAWDAAENDSVQGAHQMTFDAEHEVKVTREIAAPVDEVYAAWTEPERMRQWMARQVEADVRVGGRYRNVMGGDDGKTYLHTGEYLALEPGKRIVQSFHGFPSDNPEPNHRELLDVTLRPLGPGRTELTLADRWDGEGMDDEGTAALQDAWNGWLDGLAKLFV